MALASILGDTLVKKDKTTVQVSDITGPGKVVGLYFSAHWCPPCRAFTPQFAEWYQAFKKTANGANLEVVFVSSDRDEKSFQEYFNEMPWLALDYAKRDAKDKLSKKFKVSGIPTLVFLDGDSGKVNEADGRSVVMEDKTGENFPWTPKSFEEVFSGVVINNSKEEKKTEELKGKVLGLYFSAHWCGPCRGFTPQLVKSYNKMKEDGKNLEMVFCSSDRDEASFMEYFKEMPWLALPFGDKRKTALSRMFSVQGIPTLVFIDENFKVITTDGRSAIDTDPEGKEFPFHPKPVNMLTGAAAGTINENVSLIWFAADPAGAASFKEMLFPVADEIIQAAKAKDDTSPMDFFVTCEEEDEDDIMDGLMEFCQLDKSKIPFLVIVDVSSQSIYKDFDTKTHTADSLKTLINKYIDGKIETSKLR